MTAYIGRELELFRLARNWRSYWGSRMAPCIEGKVLEVGAGMGNNTKFLLNDRVQHWYCLEPDSSLLAIAKSEIRDPRCLFDTGTTADLCGAHHGSFDALGYFDVLEHIQDDRAEIQRAFHLLKPGGKLLVLSPALPLLFSPLDESVGHFRRYTRSSLRNVIGDGFEEIDLCYLDSIGACLSLGNRFLLRREVPSMNQLLFWDRWIVPASRLADRAIHFSVGRSILGAWRKRAQGEARER